MHPRPCCWPVSPLFVFPLARAFFPSPSLLQIVSSLSIFLSFGWLAGVSTEVVFTSCAPRGSATVYLNSDLRSDTGLKLAKEVSRCRCIQDTAPRLRPSNHVPKETTTRLRDSRRYPIGSLCRAPGAKSRAWSFFDHCVQRRLQILRVSTSLLSCTNTV